ncbi:VOC family protein [Asticcacaulis sp.]|uniref:VOC family protein n=1 Tax=Asticcacaulis sp. TaxID=1872648 RepID=UPI002CDFBCFD|nr:VOC family protein [Asticcacaulis sp.]HTM81883.1 VOC family protein [Asticcacaulis sp.]
MSVVGIGGVFFRADNPEALLAWYDKHLGLVVDFASPWVPERGPTLFMPFKRDTDNFPADRQWMINFRVKALDQLISALRDGGVEVTTNPEWDSPETGRFARIYDPEGNPIELWQPPAD